MKKVVITGSTGMIGNIILRHCLASTEIEEVICIVRKPSSLQHPKLKEVFLQNFLNYDDVRDALQDCDIAYFCIGVYTGTLPDSEFKIITVDYTKAFADALKLNSPNATLCFLSGDGADRTEKSRISFAKYKGIAENYLISKGFQQLYIFKPGYIYPVQKRKEPNFFYSSLRLIYPAIKNFIKKYSVTSEVLGQVIFTTGLKGSSRDTFENIDIRNAFEKLAS